MQTHAQRWVCWSEYTTNKQLISLGYKYNTIQKRVLCKSSFKKLKPKWVLPRKTFYPHPLLYQASKIEYIFN